MDESFAGGSFSEHTCQSFRRCFGTSPTDRSNALNRAVFTHLTRPTVYTRLSIAPVRLGRTLVSSGSFSSGNEPVPAKNVPQRVVGCFGDANTRSDLDISGAKAVVSNPQAGT
jgi:hypothetical protein